MRGCGWCEASPDVALHADATAEEEEYFEQIHSD